MTAHYETRYRAAGTPAAVRAEVARWADPAVTRLVVDRLPTGQVSAAGKVRTLRAPAAAAAADAAVVVYRPAVPARPVVSPLAVVGGVVGAVGVTGLGIVAAGGHWAAVVVILAGSGWVASKVGGSK